MSWFISEPISAVFSDAGQFRKLLASSGLDVRTVVPAAGGFSIIERRSANRFPSVTSR
jgi:hypothetical protein